MLGLISSITNHFNATHTALRQTANPGTTPRGASLGIKFKQFLLEFKATPYPTEGQRSTCAMAQTTCVMVENILLHFVVGAQPLSLHMGCPT